VAGQPLHTNFKLQAGGEYLGLFQDAKAVSVYAPKYPPQRRDVSYGLGPKDARMYFSPPTPGVANGNGVSDLVAETEVAPARSGWRGTSSAAPRSSMASSPTHSASLWSAVQPPIPLAQRVASDTITANAPRRPRGETLSRKSRLNQNLAQRLNT